MPNPFTDHPASVGEGYFEHMGQAFAFSRAMFVASLACAMHGLLPFLFLKTGSSTIQRLHTRMIAHRIKPENAARATLAPAE